MAVRVSNGVSGTEVVDFGLDPVEFRLVDLPISASFWLKKRVADTGYIFATNRSSGPIGDTTYHGLQFNWNETTGLAFQWGNGLGGGASNRRSHITNRVPVLDVWEHHTLVIPPSPYTNASYWVNGADESGAFTYSGSAPEPIAYDNRVNLGYPMLGRASTANPARGDFDLAEFCLFDGALTAADALILTRGGLDAPYRVSREPSVHIPFLTNTITSTGSFYDWTVRTTGTRGRHTSSGWTTPANADHPPIGGLSANLLAFQQPLNSAPTFTSSPVTDAIEGVAYTYNVTTTDSEGDSVTISADSPLPAWLTLTPGSPNGTATLSGTPGAGDVGLNAVQLRVSDGVLDSTQSFNIDVVSAASIFWNDRISVQLPGSIALAVGLGNSSQTTSLPGSQQIAGGTANSQQTIQVED